MLLTPTRIATVGAKKTLSLSLGTVTASSLLPPTVCNRANNTLTGCLFISFIVHLIRVLRKHRQGERGMHKLSSISLIIHTTLCTHALVHWQWKMHWIRHNTALFNLFYSQMFQKKFVSNDFILALNETGFRFTFDICFWHFRHVNVKPWEEISWIIISMYVSEVRQHRFFTIITSATAGAISWRCVWGFPFFHRSTSCCHHTPFCRLHLCTLKSGQTHKTTCDGTANCKISNGFLRGITKT